MRCSNKEVYIIVILTLRYYYCDHIKYCAIHNLPKRHIETDIIGVCLSPLPQRGGASRPLYLDITSFPRPAFILYGHHECLEQK